jgi:hypothetical protein
MGKLLRTARRVTILRLDRVQDRTRNRIVDTQHSPLDQIDSASGPPTQSPCLTFLPGGYTAAAATGFRVGVGIGHSWEKLTLTLRSRVRVRVREPVAGRGERSGQDIGVRVRSRSRERREWSWRVANRFIAAVEQRLKIHQRNAASFFNELARKKGLTSLWLGIPSSLSSGSSE